MTSSLDKTPIRVFRVGGVPRTPQRAWQMSPVSRPAVTRGLNLEDVSVKSLRDLQGGRLQHEGESLAQPTTETSDLDLYTSKREVSRGCPIDGRAMKATARIAGLSMRTMSIQGCKIRRDEVHARLEFTLIRV